MYIILDIMAPANASIDIAKILIMRRFYSQSNALNEAEACKPINIHIIGSQGEIGEIINVVR
jgi:hypothetical protein